METGALKQNNMISLVLSTYNGQKYIIKQLDSIRTQTLAPDEVIIRDDCSADETVRIVEEYIKEFALPSWHLIVNQKNLGYKENFFQGISEASGDYIFLCDQDDIWKKNKIAKMMSIFNAHPEIWTINCGVELIDGEDKPIIIQCENGWQNANFLYAPYYLPEISFFDLPYFLRHNITPGCAMALDKRTKEGLIRTYDRALPHDWHMNMIAAANEGCAYINENLIFYRRHSSNAIGANTGAINGIKSRTRRVRIEDYQSRIDGCKAICNYYGISMPNTKLMEDMISFYQSPTPFKLLMLRKQEGYKELAKNKVKLWEVLVSLRLDQIIRKMVGE